MIIHLPKNISYAYVQEFADHVGALCLEKNDCFVLITNHTVKQLPAELESMALSHWTFNTDMQLSSREYHPETHRIAIGDTYIGGDGSNQLMIAGPCAIESREQIEQSCQMLIQQGIRVLRAGCYKPRTSPYTFRGLGEDGLKLFAEMREKYGLLTAAGQSSKPVILKRGFGSTLQELVNCADFIMSCGNDQVILCERGIRSFETNTRFTLDLCGVAWLKQHCNLPIILDPSHAMGYAYGIGDLARACTAMGIDGLLIETHPCPQCAQSDAPQQLDHQQFGEMYTSLKPIAHAVGKTLV